MRKVLIISLLSLACSLVSAQTIDELLLSVEQNNAALRAQRDLQTVQTLSAKMGNSLPNPTISYDHLWGGAPGQSEKRGEMKVTQEFDFPTAYINRNALARERAVLYGHEYALARQQILLQTKITYISLTCLHQIRGIQSKRLKQVKVVAENFEKRLASGDANVMEKKRADIELVSMTRAYEQTLLDIEATDNKLVALNGGEPTGLSLEAKCDFLSDAVQPLEEMFALYESADPQMLLLGGEIAVAQRDIKASRAESLPKLELGYRYDYAPGENFNGVVMGISVPMFGNRNNVKRAKAQEQYAKNQLQSNRIDLRSTLQDLYKRREMLHNSINSFNIAHDDHAWFLTEALNAGQISITDFYTEMSVYYALFEELVVMTRDYNTVCAQIDAVKL